MSTGERFKPPDPEREKQELANLLTAKLGGRCAVHCLDIEGGALLATFSMDLRDLILNAAELASAGSGDLNEITLLHSLGEAQALGLSEGYVSKVVDIGTKKIVGYVEGATFDQQAINAIADNMNQYRFFAPWELVAHGVNLAAVFIALGLGRAYAEDWGDYGALLKALRTNSEEVNIVRVRSDVIEESEIRAIIEGLTGE